MYHCHIQILFIGEHPKVSEDFKGDIIVAENGIATGDDTRRIEFTRRALEGVQR